LVASTVRLVNVKSAAYHLRLRASGLTPLGIVCIDFPPSQRQVGRGPATRRLRGLGPLGVGCIDCPLS